MARPRLHYGLGLGAVVLRIRHDPAQHCRRSLLDWFRVARESPNGRGAVEEGRIHKPQLPARAIALVQDHICIWLVGQWRRQAQLGGGADQGTRWVPYPLVRVVEALPGSPRFARRQLHPLLRLRV